MGGQHENPFAFPSQARDVDGTPMEPGYGMTLRDWFAGQALAGECATQGDSIWVPADLAKRAYAIADAMLAARTGAPA